MAGTRFFEGSHFLSTLRCGRLPAYSLCVFLRMKMHMEFILYVNLLSSFYLWHWHPESIRLGVSTLDSFFQKRIKKTIVQLFYPTAYPKTIVCFFFHLHLEKQLSIFFHKHIKKQELTVARRGRDINWTVKKSISMHSKLRKHSRLVTELTVPHRSKIRTF